METCSDLPECSVSSLCLPPLTLPPLAPPFLYLMQEQTHLLYHDASLPLSARIGRKSIRLSSTSPASSSPSFTSPSLPAVKCPLWTESKHQHNIMAYRSKHIVHQYKPAPVLALCLPLPNPPPPKHKQKRKQGNWPTMAGFPSPCFHAYFYFAYRIGKW